MQQQASSSIPTRRRRRCQSSSPTTTRTLTLALLLTVASIEVLPSFQNYYFTARASSPASLHKKNTRRLGSTATNKNNGSNNNSQNLERVVVVQPSNLQQAMSDEDKAKFLYEVAKFGQTQEGSGGGGNTKKEAVSSEAMQATYSDGGGGEADTSIASYQEWVAMQKAMKMGSTRSGGSSSTRINMDAHAYYMPQQALGSTEGQVVDSATGGKEAPAMQQMIPEKQVILRPMSQMDDPNSSTSSSSPKKTLAVPALLGSTQNGDQEPEVYYYDAGGVTGTAYRNTPELTLPDEVFTASGQKLKLADVHDGGKAEVFLEMNPQAVLGKSLDELNSAPKTMSASGTTTSSSFLSSSSSNTAGSAAQQSQDQMIVFLTVATMAIMVGMLSARRLRSRKFLEQCMTPDLEDDLDDVRYDKKFDGSGVGSNSSNRYTAAAGAASYAYNTSGGSTLSPGKQSEYEGSETSLPHLSDLYPTQSSSIMGSLSRRSGYGTNDSVGGMHWRGDMEKFDV